VDYAVVNIAKIRPALKKRYEREQALPVENDLDQIFAMGIEVIAGNLLQKSEKIRHDPNQLAAFAIRLAQEGRQRRQKVAARAYEIQ
jgi:hypothetical protein